MDKRHYFLPKKRISHLFKLGCLQLGLKNETVGDKTIFISDLKKATNLPFVKGFIQQRGTNTKVMREVPMNKYLIDTGSDTTILSYADFKGANLSLRNLKQSGKINLRGSTGTMRD